MKACNKCKVQLADNINNCPLCGAKTVEKAQLSDMIQSPYNNKVIKPRNHVVRDIFRGVSVLIVLVGILLAVLFQQVQYLVYPILGVLFIWIAVLSHIFAKRPTILILNYNCIYLLLYAIALCLYFKVGYISASYIVPILLSIMIVTESLITFIGRRYREYGISLQLWSILSLIFLVLNIRFHYMYYISLFNAVLAVATILTSCVFGRQTLLIEIKKHLHI